MKQKSKFKFFSIYNTFSETEKSEFRLLISSPLFNKEKRNYTAILNGIESDILSDSEFTETSNKRNLWNRLSELTKLAERFLVLKATEPENFSYELILLKELKKRNLDEHFEKKFTKIKTEVDNSLFSVSKVNNLLELNNLYLDYLDIKDDTKNLLMCFS